MTPVLNWLVIVVGAGWFVIKAVLVAVVGAGCAWFLTVLGGTAIADGWRRLRDAYAIRQLTRGRAHYVKSPHLTARRPPWRAP